MARPSLQAKMRLGLWVFAALMFLEIIEYVVGLGLKRGAWLILAPLAVVAAWPIVYYFMHIRQLWRREEE